LDEEKNWKIERLEGWGWKVIRLKSWKVVGELKNWKIGKLENWKIAHHHCQAERSRSQGN
jgi:hypothetical protein